MLSIAALHAAASTSSAADTTIEAESLALRAAGGVHTDSAASGGAVLALLANGEATTTFATSASAVHLQIRVRGTSCDGAPRLEVWLDGARKMTAPASSHTLSDHGADLYLTPGTHELRIVYANDFRRPATLFSPACDRNLFVDVVRLYAPPYSTGSFAAVPLADAAPVDPASDHYVSELQRLVGYRYRDGTRMPVSTSTTSYGVPVYTVSGQQAKVRVGVDRPQWDPAGGGLEDKMAAVPLPAWAEPSQGTDQTLVVWQPSSGRLWEMWGLRRELFGEWWTRWGGFVEDVRAFPGHFGGPWPQTNWGVAASKIGLLAGLQRIEELKAGVIDHPVSVHLPAIDTSGWRWPAQGTDSRARMAGTIQEGMRFRLPADVDLDQFELSPYARIVARAVQRHGMIVTDHSDRCICFAAEDPSRLSTNPYTGRHGIFGGDRPDFTGFPWSELELVAVMQR